MKPIFKLKWGVFLILKERPNAAQGEWSERIQAELKKRRADGWDAPEGKASRILPEIDRQIHPPKDDLQYNRRIAAELRHALDRKAEADAMKRYREAPDDTIQLAPVAGKRRPRIGIDHAEGKPCLILPKLDGRYFCEPASVDDAEKLRRWLREWIDRQPPEPVEL